MQPKTPRALMFSILALTIAAGAILAVQSGNLASNASRKKEFQELVGGLGFGPALDLARCEFSFDPRLCSACPSDCGPIPGGMCWCPYHALSIDDYPPLSRVHEGPGSDAPLP
jgi:hypothetical protein